MSEAVAGRAIALPTSAPRGLLIGRRGQGSASNDGVMSGSVSGPATGLSTSAALGLWAGKGAHHGSTAGTSGAVTERVVGRSRPVAPRPVRPAKRLWGASTPDVLAQAA